MPASFKTSLVTLIITALAGQSVLPSATLSQCVDYGDYLHWTATVDTPWRCRDISIVGDLAYVANEHSGLLILGVSDPRHPLILGSVATPDDAAGVALSGTHALVADEASGLQVVDVSDPSAPVIVGSVDTPGTALGVAASATHAYVADEATGLLVVDITDPSSPTVVGSADTPGAALSVVIAGSLAYVADDLAGLQIVDISEPTAPSIIGAIDMLGRASDVEISGNFAYLANYSAGLGIVDVSLPGEPMLVGTDLSLRANGGAVSGGFTYLVGSNGLHVHDTSDPSQPLLLGSLDVGSAVAVGVSGEHAFVAGGDVHAVDITMPVPVDVLDTLYNQGTNGRSDIAVSGNLAFLVSVDETMYGSSGSLSVVDVSDPPHPEHVIHQTHPNRLECVAARGDYIYTGSKGVLTNGFQVIDVSTPSSPTVAGTADVRTYDLALDGEYAYVAGYSGMHVVDIADPTAPAAIRFVDTIGEVRAVAVSGSFAYFGADWHGLVVVDISSPESASIVGQVELPRSPRDVAVSGHHVYVADDLAGLQVVDVSDPTQPVVVAGVNTLGRASGIAVSGRYLYLACGAGGVQVFDVSNPKMPRLIGGIVDPLMAGFGAAEDVAIFGEVVYVAAWFGGLQVIPAQCDGPLPVILSGLAAEPVGSSVRLSWFTSQESRHDGFAVYRSRSVSSGYRRLNADLLRGRNPYSYEDATVRPASTYYYRLGAFDFHGAETLHPTISVTTPDWRIGRTVLDPVSPNPFRRETSLSFTLSAAGPATIAVYDIAGRRVRELVNGDLPAGDHSVLWDGRDDLGRQAAGGTYFAKLTAGTVIDTQKIIHMGVR
ncbi:MAG: hypothetical protein DHS20C21_13190 [Gemmatimonadota bacterium]|nr:MAG: hypothetical protein DHS20C21_13190 [Gemmatimonadota bacterium]